jgi:hypothetical protein
MWYPVALPTDSRVVHLGESLQKLVGQVDWLNFVLGSDTSLIFYIIFDIQFIQRTLNEALIGENC